MSFKTVLLLLAAVSTARAQALDFDTVRLDVDKVDSIDTIDMNADGRPDLVVTAGRSAKIFLFKPGAGFARTPTARSVRPTSPGPRRGSR